MRHKKNFANHQSNPPTEQRGRLQLKYKYKRLDDGKKKTKVKMAPNYLSGRTCEQTNAFTEIVEIVLRKKIISVPGEYVEGDPEKPLHRCSIYGSKVAFLCGKSDFK